MERQYIEKRFSNKGSRNDVRKRVIFPKISGYVGDNLRVTYIAVIQKTVDFLPTISRFILL